MAPNLSSSADDEFICEIEEECEDFDQLLGDRRAPVGRPGRPGLAVQPAERAALGKRFRRRGADTGGGGVDRMALDAGYTKGRANRLPSVCSASVVSRHWDRDPTRLRTNGARTSPPLYRNNVKRWWPSWTPMHATSMPVGTAQQVTGENIWGRHGPACGARWRCTHCAEENPDAPRSTGGARLVIASVAWQSRRRSNGGSPTRVLPHRDCHATLAMTRRVHMRQYPAITPGG